MKKRRVAWLLITAVLGVASVASASDPWQASLEASSIQAGPSSGLEAPLVVFVSEWTLGKSELIPYGFELSGQRIHVDIDHMEARLHTGQSFHGVAGNTTTDSFLGATAHGQENRPGYRIIVMPQGPGADLHVRSQCGELASSQDDVVIRSARAASAASRPPVEARVTEALAWQDCGQASLDVVGDFIVALWDWDFEVQGEQRTQAYQTGQLQHPALAGMPDLSRTISRDQEAWIHVENGSLSLSLPGGAQHAIYTHADAALQSNSGFLLQGATGSLGLGDQAAKGNAVHLQGSLALTVLDNQRGHLATQVQGDLKGVYVDDKPFWQSSQIAAQHRSWLMESLLGFSILAIVLFATVPQAYYRSLQAAEARRIQGLPGDSWNQRHSSAFTVMARNANQRDQPGKALAMARIASCFSDHPQARIAMAKAYKRLGWTRKALRVHERLDEILAAMPREQARNAWHAHNVARGAGCLKEADEWLELARNRDPSEFLRLSQSWPTHVADAAFT